MSTISALVPVSRPFRPLIRILVCLLITTAIYCCAFAVSTASAATYYVDDTNGNDACDGSVAQPWTTLSKTQSTVTSGDTAYFRNGSYGAYSETGVNRSNWTTYRAADGHTPVLSMLCGIITHGLRDVKGKMEKKEGNSWRGRGEGGSCRSSGGNGGGALVGLFLVF